MSIFEETSTSSEEVTPEVGQGEEMEPEVEFEEGQEFGTADDDQVEEESSSEMEQEEYEEEDNFDYKTAYKSLLPEYTRSRQELSQLRNGQQPPQDGQGEYDQEEMNNRFLEDLQRDPLGTMLNLIDARAVQQVNEAISPMQQRDFANSYNANMQDIAREFPQVRNPEQYDQFTANLKTIAQDFGNPDILRNPPKRILKMAAQETFGDNKVDVYNKAKAKGKIEAMNNLKAKQGLSGPVGAKPQETKKTDADLYREAIRNAGGRGGLFGG